MTSIAARFAPISACAICLLGACNPAIEAPDHPAVPQSGAWQGVISSPGGAIETAFELGFDETFQASLVNGQERISIDEVSFSDGSLLLRFPVFNNEIRAAYVDGKLTGELTLVKRFGETQVLPFSAHYGTDHGHDQPMETAKVDLSGRWEAQFLNEDGGSELSIGEFAQRGSRLFGTFVNLDGDHRYLAGHVDGNEFTLSTFDGAHAFLFTGNVENDAIVDGHFWSGTEWHQSWSAVRNHDAKLPSAYDRTHLREGEEQLLFEFPDQDGQIVSLTDEKFENKVMIITLSGTWCPNCNDEARLLTELNNQFHDDGLRIVSLMFEHFDDQEVASEQVRRLRDKYSIEYDTLIAGISDKAHAAEKLPALEQVLAFPTTIFVDRSAKVRTIHTGFSGPGTGEYYDTLKSEFTSLVSELIAEPEPEAQPDDVTPAETETPEQDPASTAT